MSNRTIRKYRSVSLGEIDGYLVKSLAYPVDSLCIGYFTNGERNPTWDGNYLNDDLVTII